jgi:acyl-CoA synthetase (AMP-forming)/AMP-acid ligase II
MSRRLESVFDKGLWRNPMADRYRAEGWWRDEVLTDRLKRWVSSRGDELALIDGQIRLTWRQLGERVARRAQGLTAEGVRPGDIVSTQLPNGVDIVVLHLALELIGAIHNPVAVQLREHELDQISGLLGSTLVVYAEDDRVDYRAVHARTRAGREGRARVVSELRDPSSGVRDLSDWPRPDPTGAAFILNTSGTVAMKGVVHTHENAMYGTRVVGEDVLGLEPGDVVLCVIPMTWGGGLEWGLRLAIHTGCALVTVARWDADVAAELIEREGVRFLYGPPTIAADLIRTADRWKPSRPLSMICAGAPIPRQMVTEARERLGLALLPGYGQTEHFHSTLARLTDSDERIVNCDGWPLPGVEMRVLDPHTGVEVAPGEVGELECRGPNVSAGYWNQPDLTTQTFREDGWQVTQDLGSVDEASCLRVGGRKRDIIIRGGLNVSPRELEELLSRHPDIREIAIVGRPDERYGERICAFIVPAAGRTPDVAALSALLTELGVARFKHPEEVRSLQAMPLTATGKLWPQALRDMLRDETALSASVS